MVVVTCQRRFGPGIAARVRLAAIHATKNVAHGGRPRALKRKGETVTAAGQLAFASARSVRPRTSAPTTRPTPGATKKARSPYQNESLWLPASTAATTA